MNLPTPCDYNPTIVSVSARPPPRGRPAPPAPGGALKGSTSCRFCNTWCRFKWNVADPAEKWTETPVFKESTFNPKYGFERVRSGATESRGGWVGGSAEMTLEVVCSSWHEDLLPPKGGRVGQDQDGMFGMCKKCALLCLNVNGISRRKVFHKNFARLRRFDQEENTAYRQCNPWVEKPPACSARSNFRQHSTRITTVRLFHVVQADASLRNTIARIGGVIG